MLIILKLEQNVLQIFSMPRQASAGSVSPPINLLWSFICANRKDINPMFVPKHVVALFVLKEEHADCCVEILNTLSSTSNSSLVHFHLPILHLFQIIINNSYQKMLEKKPKYH